MDQYGIRSYTSVALPSPPASPCLLHQGGRSCLALQQGVRPVRAPCFLKGKIDISTASKTTSTK
eukprot:7263352-Prorocentrum_lima.AAC.1